MDLDSMDFMSASLGEKWMAETVRRPNLFSSAQQGERRERNSKYPKTMQAVRRQRVRPQSIPKDRSTIYDYQQQLWY